MIATSQEIPTGYKRTDIGIFPEDWTVKRYADIGQIIDGDRGHHYPNKEELRDDGFCLFLNAGNVTRSGFRFDSCQFVTRAKDQVLSKGKLARNDIILTTRGTLGNFAHYTAEVPFVHLRINSGMVILRSRLPGNSIRFQYEVLRSHIVGRQIERIAFGSAQPQLTVRGIGDFLIPLPPTLAEQEAIAGALSDADAWIESLEQLIAKKRKIKQGAMQELLTGKTRMPGFSGEWELVNAGNIGRFQGGSGFPIQFQGATTGEYPLFKVSDMNNSGNETFMVNANNYISESLRRRLGATAFPAESIVFAKVGAAVFLERKKILTKPSCLDNNMAAFVMDSSRCDCRFLHYVLLNTKLGSLVSTTALPSLSGSVLASIQLLLPPLPEQIAIASDLADIDAELTALEAKLTKARQIKQGMMQELLTGRIRLV